MLGFICRIHLGIQYPRIRCYKGYDQHQLRMLHSLFPTLTILIFSCASELRAQHKGFITHVLEILLLNANIKYSFVPELLSQYKTSNTHVIEILLFNTKISSIMCLRLHAKHINNIYKTYAISLCPIYQTNHHVHV